MGQSALSFLAVALGAAVGAWSRWGLSLWLNARIESLPLGTLLANLGGGYLIGIAVGVFQDFPNLTPEWRLLVVTGFLGGLTTFSTFSAEVVDMLQQGRLFLALSSAGLHLFGSLLLTWAGLYTVRFLGVSPMP